MEPDSVASSWARPWSGGAEPALGPFDAADRLERRSPYCGAQLGALGPEQTEARVVPCADCPMGYELGAGALRCRPYPACAAPCTTCQIHPNRPFASGSCDACISYGCDPHSNRCACG
jgi:hypothetical protein